MSVLSSVGNAITGGAEAVSDAFTAVDKNVARPLEKELARVDRAILNGAKDGVRWLEDHDRERSAIGMASGFAGWALLGPTPLGFLALGGLGINTFGLVSSLLQK